MTLNVCYQGLKTGMYYLRTKPAANALQFTLDKSKLKNTKPLTNGSFNGHNETGTNDMSNLNIKDNQEDAMLVCSRENGDACMMCSG